MSDKDVAAAVAAERERCARIVDTASRCGVPCDHWSCREKEILLRHIRRPPATAARVCSTCGGEINTDDEYLACDCKDRCPICHNKPAPETCTCEEP